MHHITWAVVATAAFAQAPLTQPARPDSPAAAAPAPAQPQSRPDTVFRLSGTVLDVKGKPLFGAVITVARADTGKAPLRRRVTSDSAGQWSVVGLDSGAYRIRIEHSTRRSSEVVETLRGETTGIYVLRSRWLEVGLTVACLLLYGLSLVLARWHHIARSLHAIIRRQLTALRTRLDTEMDGQYAAEIATLRQNVDDLLAAENAYSSKGLPWKFSEILFWSRGHENAAWIAIHEIERQLAAFISPAEQVDVSLRWAEAELREIKKPGAVAIADAIHTELEAPGATDPAEQAKQEKRRRALLGRAFAIANAERDLKFASLMEWQNKAGWLILGAMIMVGFLAGTVGRAVLFLAGAAGGYISRVMRALKRDDVPLDYGASWATLFLSPLFGAFMGWFGVALIVLAASPTLNLLGPAFHVVDWDNPYGAVTVAIAFLLGFSERFFDAIVGSVEARAGVTPEGEAPVRVNPPATPAAQPKPPAAPGAPVISAITRQSVATGAAKDALVVRGTGFDPKATASLNTTTRPVEFQTAEALLIVLTKEDVDRIENAGETIVAVANPGGASSAPMDYEE